MALNARTYTPKKAGDVIGCSADTIRRYCSLYGHHLSDGATPRPGQARILTEEDLHLLGIAKRETEFGRTIEEIDELLATVALPESLAIIDDEAIVETSPEVPEAVALLRQMATTLGKLEARDERVAKLEADVETLRASIVSDGKPSKARLEDLTPLMAFTLGIFVVVAVAVLFIFLAQVFF